MGVSEAASKLIVGLTSTFAGSVGQMMDPEINPNERYVFRDPYGGRLDENQAQWVAENARNEFAAAKSREAQTGFIDYNVPLVAGPGIRSQTADLFLPMRNQWSTAGGVSLNANAPTSSGFFSNHPYNPLAYNPLPYTGDPLNPPNKTLNTVPPWGEPGSEGIETNQHPGIDDEQETIRQTIDRENQEDIARLLEDIGGNQPTGTEGTVAGDPNPIDIHAGGTLFNPNATSVENSILSGKGSQDLRAGGLANYADEVFGAHETWSDTPSQMEDWSWKNKLTGYDPSGKFAWGKDANYFDTHGNPYAAAYAQQGLEGGGAWGQKFKLPDLTSKGPQAKAPGKPAQVSGSENVWWQG